MLRNEVEYRNAKKRLENLRAEVEKRSLAEERETPGNSRAVVEALNMKIDDIKREIAEYDDLKNGRVSEFEASDLDEFGEMVTKVRIARGWSQADLAEALGTHQQQVQRYERNDWQKINLWRLQEVVEALRLHLNIYARLEDEAERPGASWPRVTSFPHHTIARDYVNTLCVPHTATKAKAMTVSDEENLKTSESQPAMVSAPKLAEPIQVS
jgi:ribosome-binding protein aMBF1 (putative translation factor)